MLQISPRDLLAYAKGLEGQTLRTLYDGAEFAIAFQGETLVFTPSSTGKPRPHQQKYLDRVCEAFSGTNSLKPGDYNDGTFNASYTLTLIVKYLGAIADGTFESTPTRRV